MSDKTILFRKQGEVPVVSGWYFCRVNETSHPRPSTEYYDTYSAYRSEPIPVYVYVDFECRIRIEVDTEGEESSCAEDYLWYGSVPEIRILP